MRVQLFAAWSVFLLYHFGACMETDDPLHDQFKSYATNRKVPEPGCMLEEARWCFVFFANVTTQAMATPDRKMRSHMCSEGKKYVECIEHFKGCAKEEELEKGMAMKPYMKILQAMHDNICEEDEMPDADHKAKCDSAIVLGYCVMDFFFTAADMMTSTQFNPSETICWQSQKSLQCISDSMHSCSNRRVQGLVGMLANQMKLTKAEFCRKPGCNPDAAMESMQTVRNALNSRLTDLKGSPLLCGILQYELDNMMKYIKGCPQKVYDQMSGGIGLVYELTKKICAKNPRREMQEKEMLNESQLVMTVLTNPFSTQKDICPLVATAASKLLRYASEKASAEDILDTLDSLGTLAGPYCMKSLLGEQGYDCNYTQSKMCDMNRAKVCIDHAELSFYIKNMDNLGPDAICHGVSQMAKCIEYTTAGCAKNDISIESLDPKIPQLFSMVAEVCPLASMLLARMKCNTEKCEIRQALIDCFPMPSNAQLAAGEACKFVNQSLTCVNRLTSGCGKLPSTQTVSYALKEYLNYLKPYCYHRLADSLLEMLPDCTVQYINGVRDMMYMSTNFTNDMCMFMSHMASNEKCTSLVSMMSAVDLSGSAISDQPMIQYYLNSCPTDVKALNHSKPASVQEPASCASFSAAISASVYWHRFMMLPFLPLSERKEVCSDGPYIEESIDTMIANCSSTRKQAFMEASQMVMTVYNYFCPKKSMPMQDHSCNLNASLNCLGMLGDYFSKASSFHMEQNCMKVGMAFQCVANYTKNCTATELASIKGEIAPVLSVVGNSCENLNKAMCNISAYPEHAAVLQLFHDPTQCNEATGLEMLSLFNASRPILQNNTMLLCSLAMKASVKAMKSVSGCDASVKSSLNATLQTLKNGLKDICVNTSMMHSEDESCPGVKTNIGCSTDFDGCFPSSSPEDICRDGSAIAACVTLKMRGCDDIIQSEVHEQFGMIKASLENATGLTCNIVPTTSVDYKRPSFRQDMVCAGGRGVYTNYLYNDSATERDLCSAFSTIVDCLKTNTTYLPKFWYTNYFEIVKSVKKQIYYRCQIVDNMDLVYMDKPKNATEYNITDPECRIPEAVTCMDSYMTMNMFAGMLPLSERVSACGKVPKALKCVYNNTAACPTAIRKKILRAVDWFDSIGSMIGVCKTAPLMCKPEEAMNCLSMMANGYVATRGMGQDSAVCAGLVPTETCVKNYMMGCSAQERMMMEDSLRTVIGVVYQTCTPEDTEDKEMALPDMEDRCDMEKIHHYMKKLFEMGPMAMSADHMTRKMKCGKMMEVKSGIEKLASGCPKETAKKIKGLASLGDVALMAVCEKDDMKYESKVCSATALGCLHDYVGISMKDTLPGYCRQVKSTMTCLGEVMKSCGEDHRVIAGMVVKEMKKYASEMCEARECNPALAHRCMTEADSLLELSPMKFKTSPILCGGLRLALTCVAAHAKGCDHDDQPLLMHALRSRHMLGKQMCPEMGDYNSVVKLAAMYNIEGMVAFTASVASPFATKESVCPQYNYMEKMVIDAAQYVTPKEYVQLWQLMNIPRQIVRGFCYDASEDNEYIISDKTAQCNVSMMMECAMHANIPQRINSAIFYGWEPVCESLEKLVCCMNHASGACTDKRSQMVATQLNHDLFNLVGNKCSVTDVVAKTMATCPMSLPERCEGISVITSKCFLDIRSDADKSAICRNLTEIVSCVREHTKGCSSYQTTAYAFGLKKYKDWMQSQCDLSGVEVDILNKDEMSDVSNCNMEFMESMYKTLTETSDMEAGLCSAMNSAASCYEKADNLPLTLLYDLEASEGVTEEIHKMVCNKTRSTVSFPSEPATCMFDVASVMLTSYLEHISKMTFIPLSDRPNVCSGMLDVKVAVDMLTADCSQGRRDMLGNMIKMIRSIHKEVCPLMLPVVMKMENVCLPEMAQNCVNYFGMYANGVPANAEEYACGAFYDSAKCVHASTKSCPAEVLDGMVSSLYTAKSLLGNTCPLLNGIMYNVSMFRQVVQNATCNQEAAYKCMTDLEYYMASEKGNMEKVCRVYPMTLACVMINTMLCDKDETEEINSTLHTILSTTGKQCMMINPETPKHKPQPVCSVMWQKCLPMGSTEDICDNVNGVNISTCIDEKLDGCDNITKLSLIREMRMYSSNLVMQSKNRTCHVGEGILNSTNDLVQYLYNNTCDLQFTHNLTALLNNASSTWKDFCMFLDNMTKCMMMEAEISPLVYKGVTQAAAYRLMEQQCYHMEMMDESMTDKPSNTSRVMAELMKMNMSQFYNKTVSEPASCQQKTAVSCLTQFASATLYGGFSPLGDRSYLCSGALHLHKCVINSTIMCSPMTRNRFMFVLNKFTNLGKSQGFCQDNPEIAVKGLKGELMMEECKHDKAMECLGKLSAAISMYQYSSTKSAVCSLLLPVEMCVETHTFNCMDNVRMSIMSTYKDLSSAAKMMCSKKEDKHEMDKNQDEMDMSKCEMEMRESKSTMCDVPHALMCITSMEAKVKKNPGSVCGMLPEVRSCIKKFTSGCKPCQKDSVEGVMKAIYHRVKDRCPELMCDSCGAMKCMMMLNQTRQESKVTCLDIWKAQQCVKMYTSTCGDEMKQRIHMKMSEGLRKHDMPSCPDKRGMTQCLGDFGMLAKNLLNLRSKDLPDISELMKMMDGEMERTPDRNQTTPTRPSPSMQQVYVLRELHRILAGHMMMNNTCNAESRDSDMEMMMMMDDKDAMCKKAWSIKECVMGFVEHLPKEIMPVVNVTLHAVGEALMDKCSEKPLRCFSCRGAYSNEECNMQPKQTCYGKNQICYANIQNGSYPLYYKGCTTRIPMASTREKKCYNGSRCMYFCDKPDCNYHKDSKTVEPPSCDRKQAMVCGMEMVHSLVKSQKLDCGVVQKNLYCMHYHLSECISGTDYKIFKQVEEALKSKEMVQCYAEAQPCRCGNCLALIFEQAAMSPYVRTNDVCSLAEKMQKGIFTSMLWDDCSSSEMKNMYEGARVVMTMLGDNCDTRSIGEPAYNSTCQLDVAKMCFEALPLKEAVQNTPKNKSGDLCMRVLRMFTCMHMHAGGCDKRVALGALEGISREALALVKDHCDTTELSNVINETVIAARTNSPEHLQRVERMSKAVMKKVDMEAMEIFQKVVTMTLTNQLPACEPSLAYHNCFYIFETDHDICTKIQQAYECTMVMTKGCLEVQKSSIMYIMSVLAPPTIVSQCNFPNQSTADDMKNNMMDPYYNLSMCVVTFAHTVQQALSNPKPDSQEAVCNMTYYLDRCVYITEVPDLAKPMSAHMAMVTSAIKEAACYGIGLDMSDTKCKEDDLLCHVLRNLTQMSTSDPNFETSEPQDCNVDEASVCVAAHMSRILTWPFAPMDESDDLCQEQQYTLDCVDRNTRTCSFNRRQTFNMTMTWLQMITEPGCSLFGGVSNPTCSAAQKCMHSAMSMVLDAKAYEDMNTFCWKSKKVFDCVQYHAYNCSEMEFSYITESLTIFGNLTYYYCSPELAMSACPLTKMPPMEVGKVCEANKMRACVHAYYEQTYEKSLDQANYCKAMDTALSCIAANSSNCHPGVIEEMHLMMKPGVMTAGYNCTSLTNLIDNMYTCPPVGMCPVTDVETVIFEAIETAKKEIDAGSYQCFSFLNVIDKLRPNISSCNPLETQMINYLIGQFSKVLPGVNANTCLNRALAVTGRSDPWFNNYTMCAKSLGDNLTKAMTAPEYGFYDICRSAAHYRSCVTQEFEQAKRPGQMFMQAILNQTTTALGEFLEDTCASINASTLTKLSVLPPEKATCKADIATGCVVSYATQAMFIGTLNAKDMMAQCGAFPYIYQCFANYTKDCSSTVTHQLQVLMILSREMVLNSGMCPRDLVEREKRSMAMYVMEMLQANKQVDILGQLIYEYMETKEKFMRNMMDSSDKKEMEGQKEDDDKKEMSDQKEDDDDREEMGGRKEDDDGEMEDRMEDGEMDHRRKDDKKMCMPVRATYCVAHTLENVAQLYHVVFEGATFCRKMEDVHRCVELSIEGCDDTTKAMALQQIMVIGHVTKILCTQVQEHIKMMYMANMRMNNTDMAGMRNNTDMAGMRNGTDMAEDKDDDMGEDKDDDMAENKDMAYFDMKMDEKEDDDEDKEEDEMEDDSSMMDMKKNIAHNVMSFMMDNDDMMRNEDVAMKLAPLYAIAPEDGECVDPQKYREHAQCVPSLAMQSMNAVDMEMLHPLSTRERLCLKYSVATRIYMMTSQGCDYIDTFTLASNFEYLKYKVGDRCPTVVKSPCQDVSEKRCRVHEVEECLTELYQTLYAGKYFLPSSIEPMCQSVHRAQKCMMKKIEHCDARVNYTLYDSIRPSMSVIDEMCTNMPALGCVTSFMWKTASILFMTMDIDKMGSEAQKIEYMKAMNMTIPNDFIDKMLESQDTSYDGGHMNAENVEMVMKWLHRITNPKAQCDDDKEMEMDKYGMDNILHDMGAAIKYVFMDTKMIAWDPEFKATVEMAVKSDDIIMTMVRALGASLRENRIPYKESEIMQSVIRYVVSNADSTKVLEFYFSKLVKAKIDSLMPVPQKEKEMEEEMEEMMMEWIKKEIVTEIRDKMEAMISMKGSLEKGMKFLHHVFEETKMQKMSMCQELVKAAECMESFSHLIPYQSKALVDLTTSAMGGLAHALCEPTKCFSCSNQRNNYECNKQGMQTCDSSQGCSVTVRNGMISKSCAYSYAPSEDPENFAMYCSGSYCNSPAMETDREYDDSCKPMKAIQCLFDIVPSVITRANPDMRLIYKAADCIEKSTKRCVVRSSQELGDVGMRLKHASLTGVCSGNMAEYQCGLRSVLHLSSIVNDVMSSPTLICSELKETVALIENAYKNNLCSDHEMMVSYEGLQTIFSVIGPHTCPNINLTDKSFCPAELMNIKSSGKCDLEGAEKCISDLMMDEKIARFTTMEPNEKDHLCRDLWVGTFCVMPKILSCSEQIQNEVGKNMTDRLMIAINHCPAYKSVHENCMQEPQYKTCQVGTAMSSCLLKYLNVNYDLCQLDEAQITSDMHCVMTFMDGCTVVQGAQVAYLLEHIASNIVASCGSRTTSRTPLVYSNMMLDMVTNDIMAYVSGVTPDSWRKDMPVTKILDVMLQAKMIQMRQRDFNTTEMFYALSDRLQNATSTIVSSLQIAMVSDNTAELAKCTLQFASRVKRALMYPAWTQVLMCEGLTATQKCLASLELSSPVTQMDVWSMMDKIEGDREMLCQGYMEDVMYLGSYLTNRTAQMMNTTMSPKVYEVIEHMMNGSLATSNITAQDILMVFNSTASILDGMFLGNETCDTSQISSSLSSYSLLAFIVPFTSYMDHLTICFSIHEIDQTIIPEIRKCSKENQEIYDTTISWIKNRTNHICKKGEMIIGEKTCNIDGANECLQYVLPYVKSMSTTPEKLCSNLHMALICMDLNTKTCKPEELTDIAKVIGYVAGMVGNSCPYVTALTTCYADVSQSGSVCNATKAIMCTYTLDVDPSKPVTPDVCSKLPPVLTCIQRNMAGCTNNVMDKLSVKAVMSYLEVGMIPINKVCSKEEQAKNIYSQLSCTAPPVCSFKDAFKCYEKIKGRETCSAQEATDTKACVMSHLRGCNPIQQSVFNATAVYHRNLYPGCKAYEIDLSVVPTDNLIDQVGINYCMSTFKEGLSRAVTTPDYALPLLCHAFKSVYECLHTGMDEKTAAGWDYILGDAFSVTGIMVTDICENVPTITREAMSRMPRLVDTPGCNLTPAANALATYTILTGFSSGFTQKDKMDYCNMTGSYSTLVAGGNSNMSRCTEEEKAGLVGLKTLVHTVHLVSGVCSKVPTTCSPRDAANCGVEVKQMMEMKKGEMTDKDTNRTMWNEEYCQMAKHQLECVTQYTYGCSKEVHTAAVMRFEEDYCVLYDLISNCPSMQMPKALEKLPECIEKEDAKDDRKNDSMVNDKADDKVDDKAGDYNKTNDKEESCDVGAALKCFMELDGMLSSPFKDCRYMKGAYTKSYRCFDRHTEKCPEAAWVVLTAVMKKMGEKVADTCPDLPLHSCMEPPTCQADEAFMCLKMLTGLLYQGGKLENSHLCSAMDLTGMCMHEKVSGCSGFMRRVAYYYYDSTRKAVMKSMNLTCEATLDSCAENAYQSSLAIIHGETMMAKLLKKKAMFVDHAMERMMYGMDGDVYDQMDMIAANMSKSDKETSMSFIDLLAKDMMTNDTQKTSSDYLMHFYTSIIKLMTREVADFRDVYTKVKVLQCMNAHQASKCVAKHLNSSSLRPDTMELVTRTMRPMYDIVSGMCEADSQCSVMEEPDSCMILQASMMTMMQNGYLMMNKTHFCKTLPYTIEKVKNMTDDCSSDLRENFGSIVSSYKKAHDTYCRVQHQCEVAVAQKCIDTFTAASNDCSLYETTLTCVTNAIKGCNTTVTGRFTRMLEESRRVNAANCETLSPFITNATTVIRIVEGGSAAMLEVRPSESPSSHCEAGKTCEFKVRVEITQDSKSPSCPGTQTALPQLVVPAMSSTDGCSSMITGDNWQQGKMIWLKAQSDLLHDGLHEANVSIYADKYSDGVMVISRKISEYQVVVRDTDDDSFCSFEGNIVNTFDKKVYTNGYMGEFVLYKHKQMPYEVRTLSTKCKNKRKACMCAVMIKIQDFVIMYDKCRQSSADMAIKVFMPNGLPNGLKIYTRNAGRVMNVNMPTGTMVQVSESKKGSLSVVVQRSSLDWENTEGLCGFYDNDKSNDWMMQNSAGQATNKRNFILGYRKNGLESLSRGAIADFSYKQPRQCTCAKSGSPVPETCADMLVARSCQIQMGQEYTTDLLQLIIEATQSNTNSRRKRQAQDPLSGLDIDLDYQPPELTWPTPSNWTEAMATEYCDRALSTPAAIACQPYLDAATVTSYKETCILSIQENDGSTSFMDTMMAQCQLQLYRLASTDDSAQISQTLSQLCENDCSNNGDCRNATCTCYRGWLGADCSIPESVAPVLQTLENNGLCTLDSTRQCNEFFVTGENFASELGPSCHFQMVTAAGAPTGNEEVHQATFMSSTQMICTVPAAMATAGASRRLLVSVSNDGQTKSQAQLFVSYHPRCYDCDASTKQCSLSMSGCVIADVCYEKGDANPANICQFCDSVTDKTTWTHKIVPNCPGSLTTQPSMSTTTSQTTTTPTTTTPTTTTPTTPVPTTPSSNSNPNCNQGQVGTQSTEAPESSQNDTPLIVVSIVAGVLLLICIILSCKMCHDKDLERVERKKRAYSAKSSSPPSSIEDSSREYDNFAYDPNQEKKNVYQSGLLPGDIGGTPPKSFPPYSDKVTVEDENLTKL